MTLPGQGRAEWLEADGLRGFASGPANRNPAFRFDPEVTPGRIVWRPYDGVPAIVALTNGAYRHEPEWYRNFLYEEERARGLDDVEDLASPGVLTFDLCAGEATLCLGTD